MSEKFDKIVAVLLLWDYINFGSNSHDMHDPFILNESYSINVLARYAW